MLGDAGGCATRRIIMTSLLGAAAFLTPGGAKLDTYAQGAIDSHNLLALVKSHGSTSHLSHYRQTLTEIEWGQRQKLSRCRRCRSFNVVFYILAIILLFDVVTYCMASYLTVILSFEVATKIIFWILDRRNIKSNAFMCIELACIVLLTFEWQKEVVNCISAKIFYIPCK